MNRCVIVGGADIGNYEEIKTHIQKEDDFFFCDSGLKHRQGLGVDPVLIVGDFDSFDNPHLDVETIVLPREKDDTDTSYAVGEAIKRGYREVCMIGVTGGRMDHTLVNIFLLFRLDANGIKACIIDDCSEMRVISREKDFISDPCLYFSLVNMTGTARGITIRNAKYEVENAEIESEYQYATSNEVLPGKTAEVSVEEGRLLLVIIRKEAAEPWRGSPRLLLKI